MPSADRSSSAIDSKKVNDQAPAPTEMSNNVIDTSGDNDIYKSVSEKSATTENNEVSSMLQGVSLENSVKSEQFEKEFGQEGGGALRNMGFDSASYENNKDGSVSVTLNRSYPWTSPSGTPSIGKETSFDVSKADGNDHFLAKNISGLDVRTPQGRLGLENGVKVSKADDGSTKLTIKDQNGKDGPSMNLPTDKQMFEAISGIYARARQDTTNSQPKKNSETNQSGWSNRFRSTTSVA
jgi:hypothetical protein